MGVVLTVPSPDAYVQDFANEVKMCQRVNHPCCIKTLGWAKSPKYIIVQELVGFGWATAPACACARACA